MPLPGAAHRPARRDHVHGRIWRVTAKDRELTHQPKFKGKPIAEVCKGFFERANAFRYRARLELSGRSPGNIARDVQRFADTLDPKKASIDRNEAQALLECLWVFEEQRIVNEPLLRKVFQAEEPRIRAAAIRTLGHWAGKFDNWKDLLSAGGRDSSALVRAEAVKAAVEFANADAAEAFFESALSSSREDAEAALRELAQHFDLEDSTRGAFLAMICGM